MARTLNLNLTGAAARTELADQRQWQREAPDREVRAAKQRFASLQFELAELMGEAEFSRWYDDDHNIPPILQWTNMAPIFEKMEDAIKNARRPAAPGRPASNEPGQQHTASTTDPTDCITESEGE